MKSLATKISILLIVILFSGCAKTCNRQKANGGIIGSYSGDWIVITYSGNHITDVWKLKDVMVQSEPESDGWLFIDNNDNVIHIGGNTKAIRVEDKEAAMWDKYVEYHSELTHLTYQEFALGLKENKEVTCTKEVVATTPSTVSVSDSVAKTGQSSVSN